MKAFPHRLQAIAANRMNRNAEAITIFCSHLCVTEGINPLEPREWSDLAQRLMDQGLQPESLLDYGQTDFAAHLGFSEEEALRLVRLLDRSGSLRFELRNSQKHPLYKIRHTA